MATRIFYQLDELLSALRSVHDEADVFSFDVFDTLLIRRIHDPDHVKGAVARFLSHRAAGLGIQTSDQRLLKRRAEIEAMHRLRNGNLSPDQEARYPDYMGELVREIFGPDQESAMLREVTDFELELENRVLLPRRGWAALLEELHDKGKTLIALSDMYLPSSSIRNLLEHAGLAKYFHHILSSADDFHAKASGAGFARLIRRHGYSPHRWVHTGDNPHSDALIPDALRIRSFLLKDVRERKRKSILQRYFHSMNFKPFWLGRYVMQMAAPLEAEIDPVKEADPLYRTGYTVFAPLLCGFIQHLLWTARERKIPVLYVLSREGWMFQKLWERMMPVLAEGGPVPEIRYLHVSRRALAGASCGVAGLSRDVVEISLLPAENRDFRDICRVADLDLESCLPYLHRHQLCEDTPLSPHHAGYQAVYSERLQSLLDDSEFQEQVRTRARSALEGLIAYLHTLEFFSDRHVGLVDIGWLGTIQRLLNLCLAGQETRPVLHGLYFAATRKIPFPKRVDSHLEGWIYNGRRDETFAGALMEQLECFEEVCRPAQPGLLRYDVAVAGCRVFREAQDPAYLRELAQSRHMEPLQAGILDSAPRYAVAQVLSHRGPALLRLFYAQILLMKFSFPTSSDLRTLKPREHVNDFADPTAAKGPRKARRLWDRSPGQIKWMPFLKTWYWLKRLLQQSAEIPDVG